MANEQKISKWWFWGVVALGGVGSARPRFWDGDCLSSLRLPLFDE